MIDTSKIIHVPNSVKITVISILVLMLAASVYFTVYYATNESDADWVILSFSVAQLAASGLILFVLLIFSERHTNEKLLKIKSRDFMEVMFPKAIEAVGANVKIAGTNGPLMNFYEVSTDQNNGLTIGFLFNLKRFALYLYLSKSDPRFKNLDDVKAYFAHGFEIAQSIGYVCSVAESDESFTGERCYTLVFMKENLSDDFLGKPIDKLFYTQDMAQMISWYLSQHSAGELKFL